MLDTTIDETTHCPINKDGKPITSHLITQNIKDFMYVSDMFIGNPPQKVRGLFDTGSTNTWILNKNTKSGKVKEYSYDETKSKSHKKTSQTAVVKFGSGDLAGHFYTDDLRLGTCDGKTSS